MRQRIKMGALTGLLLAGLVSTTLAATSPASAGDAPDPVITGSTKAGYLDRTFVGGKGYRVIPKPADASAPSPYSGSGSASGQAVLVSQAGRIRTVTRHYVTPAQYYGVRTLLRSWTADGWIDRSFYSGKARTLSLWNENDGGTWGATATAQESVSYVRGGYGMPITVQRLGRDGRLDLSQDVFTQDEETIYATELLPSGAWISCSNDVYSPDPQDRVATFWDAAGQQTGSATFVGEGRCGVEASGSHLWMVNGGRIARSTLNGVLDPSWGGDGYIETDTVRGWQGMPDGSLYVSSSANVGGVSILKLARFTPSGDPDVSFGSGGVVQIGGSSPIVRGRNVESSTWQIGPKGPVLALTVSSPGVKDSTRYRIIRLNKANGSLDLTFGSSGIIQTSTRTTSIVHDAQGRILTLDASPTGSLTLARRNG